MLTGSAVMDDLMDCQTPDEPLGRPSQGHLIKGSLDLGLTVRPIDRRSLNESPDISSS